MIYIRNLDDNQCFLITYSMTRPSKRKINVKEQERDNNGRFAKKIQTVDNWGDDDDSGWDYDNGQIMHI